VPTPHLFGFFGPANSAHSSDLEAYSRKTVPTADTVVVTAASPGRVFVGAAEQIVRDGPWLVLLHGSPVWNEGDRQAATAEAIAGKLATRGVPACLASLGGRFALSVANLESGQLTLAIDRMGIERLTYVLKGPATVFSSSAAAVARCPSINARIDRQAMFDYLLHHMIPAPRTAFQGVNKLPAASYVEVSDGQAKTEPHWEPAFCQKTDEGFDALKAQLLGTLSAAVSDCMPDARSGAFLSGGLDSSSVAGMLSQTQGRGAKTFSIGFGYPDYDELPFARAANGRFGCQGHEYVIRGQDIADSFALIAGAFDEPFGNSSALPAYHCGVLARESGVDHLLAGDGGDELFAGNTRYVEQRVFERYQSVPGLIRHALLEPLVGHWPKGMEFWLSRKAKGYITKAKIPLPARLETWNFVYMLGPETIIAPDFLASIDPAAPFSQMQAVWDACKTPSYLQKMLQYDWHYTLADNDLRKVEVTAALAGIRVSYPMLDNRVVDLSTRIPPDLMMPGDKLRDFYKRSVAGFLPDEIIHKKKHGFGLPFGLWLQESSQLRDMVYGNLSQLRGRGIIRADFIDRILRLHASEDAKFYGVFIWVLAVLEQWFEETGFDV